jgi:hypothetical protein
MRFWLALVLLAGCTSPLGQVCNPRGECVSVATTEHIGPMNDYIDYVPETNNTVYVTIIDSSHAIIRMP